MAKKIERFEDLIAWQKARALRLVVARLTREPQFRRDLSLADQMRRSARSIMADIAEGFDKYSRPEFHRFLGMAKGSCAELRSDLYTLLDDELISQAVFDRLYALCDEEVKVIAGLRSSLRVPEGAR